MNYFILFAFFSRCGGYDVKINDIFLTFFENCNTLFKSSGGEDRGGYIL